MTDFSNLVFRTPEIWDESDTCVSCQIAGRNTSSTFFCALLVLIEAAQNETVSGAWLVEKDF
jgi:hypothetical protein